MNIFDMADENSDSLRSRYDSLRTRFQSQSNLPILDEFTELIKDSWTISVNVKQWDINSLLISGRYENVREVKRKDAERLQKYREELEEYRKLELPLDKALEGHLKNYHVSRLIFESEFEDGEKFKYAALNIGGLGAQKYGLYCVVFKRKQIKEYSTLVFAREDSLNKYVDYRHGVNVRQLAEDISNRECVHCMTALKHEGGIESTAVCDWPSMICCSQDYIEAITADDLPVAHIDSIRVSKKYFKPHFDLLYKHWLSEVSDDSEKYRLTVFKNMLELMDENKIRIEVLSENGN